MLVCPDSYGVKAIQMLLRKFYPKSSFVPTTAEKDSKKNNEKNKLFILPQQTSVNYRISCYIFGFAHNLFLFLINLYNFN